MPPQDPKFTVQTNNVAYSVWEGGSSIKVISSLTTDGDLFAVKSRSKKLFGCCCSDSQIFGLFSTYIAVVEISDLIQSKPTAWKKLADVPSQTPEYSHLSIAEVSNSIYFFAFEREFVETEVHMCRAYSLTKKQWYNLDHLFVSMSSRIIGYHTLSKADKLLVLTASVEDVKSKQPEFTITYIYTDETPTNTIIKRITIPNIHRTLFAHKTIIVDQKLFISGGIIISRVGYSHNNRIYIFDLETKEITGHIMMTNGRCFHHCMVLGDTFVITGGQLNKPVDPKEDLFVSLDGLDS